MYISLHSENGKLYLNNAEPEDFSRLAVACGATQAQASEIAGELEARRNNGQSPFRLLEEVQQLPGMTQTLYRRLLPEITLWSGFDRPDPAFAQPFDARCTGFADVVVIDSRALMPGGYTARLQVTVLLTPAQGGEKAYEVLRWEN